MQLIEPQTGGVHWPIAQPWPPGQPWQVAPAVPHSIGDWVENGTHLP